jgi:excisionase family DNA binding protein
MQPSDYPLLLNRKQASQLTGLDEKYFDRLRHAGTLRTYVTAGGLHRFYRDEVLAHIGVTFSPTTTQPTIK